MSAPIPKGPKPAHASAPANSHSSFCAPFATTTPTDTISERVSSSSRESRPAAVAPAHARTAAPPKHARSYRRTKSSKAAANRWSEAAAPQASTPQTLPAPVDPAADEPLGTAHPAPARLMAAAFGGPSGDSRRGVSSPRPKGREAKNTFCRNVTIYGHCRYENSAYTLFVMYRKEPLT